MNLREFPSTLVRSFYSPTLYRRVVKEWSGIGGLYLVVLAFLVWVLLGVRFFFAVNAISADPDFQSFMDQLPAISIEDGVVEVDAPQPYRLLDPESPETVFIIDTTGATSQVDADAEQGMLLTRDRLYLKRSRFETREFDLSQVESFSIDAERIKGWIGPVALAMAGATMLFMPLVSIAYRIVLSQILAGLGFLITKVYGFRLDWAALSRLAVVAMTPAFILSGVVSLLAWGSVSGCFGWLLWGAINSGFVFFGISANRPSTRVVPHT